MDICPVCRKPLNECVCCPECGHVCPLDLGEPYCPVCKPDPKEMLKATIESLKKMD